MNTHIDNTASVGTTAAIFSDIDAGAMHKDYLRDRRIERILRSPAPRLTRTSKRSSVKASHGGDLARDLSDLQATTGWSPEDAISEFLEAQRDLRLFGGRAPLFV